MGEWHAAKGPRPGVEPGSAAEPRHMGRALYPCSCNLEWYTTTKSTHLHKISLARHEMKIVPLLPFLPAKILKCSMPKKTWCPIEYRSFFNIQTSMPIFWLVWPSILSAAKDTLHWLSRWRTQSTDSCIPNCIIFYIQFCPRTEIEIWARGWKFKAQCYYEEACPNCMHIAQNSTYFVQSAAVH